MESPARLTRLIDAAITTLLALLLCGVTLAFGGAVWWFGPLLAATAALMVGLVLARSALNGSLRILKSPLALLWVLTLGLGVVQLVPLPGPLAERLSPRARTVHALGVVPGRLQTLDPESTLPAAGGARTPATLDRPATLRWLAGASCCLAVFWAVSLHADRLRRTLVVWGCVVGCLFVVTLFGVVQVACGAHALYGVIVPGSSAPWAPSAADLASVPNRVTLPDGLDAAANAAEPLILPRPATPAAIGGLMGGPGAYLALAALGLPLAFALGLHLIAPRSPRERLGPRLTAPGRGGLALVTLLLSMTSAALLGVLGGLWLCLPVAVGLVLVGVLGSFHSGQPRLGALATALVLLMLLAGARAGARIEGPTGGSPLAAGEAGSFHAVRAAWISGLKMARDFRWVGAGLGAYPALEPYYKSTSEDSTTAWSTLIQWAAESGLAGVSLLALACLWFVARMPGAIARVGPADRTLAWGLVAAVISFAAFSAIHWTGDLRAIALAASAVLGGAERWLAGGNDLFVEHV